MHADRASRASASARAAGAHLELEGRALAAMNLLMQITPQR
ncbi:MAG TPA: hypothetical protein VIT65_09060 [Microlunatus sp.]